MPPKYIYKTCWKWRSFFQVPFLETVHTKERYCRELRLIVMHILSIVCLWKKKFPPLWVAATRQCFKRFVGGLLCGFLSRRRRVVRALASSTVLLLEMPREKADWLPYNTDKKQTSSAQPASSSAFSRHGSHGNAKRFCGSLRAKKSARHWNKPARQKSSSCENKDQLDWQTVHFIGHLRGVTLASRPCSTIVSLRRTRCMWGRHSLPLPPF